MYSYVRTITLAEIPFTDLIKIRPIYESGIVWYRNGMPTQEVKNLKDYLEQMEEIDVALEYCMN